MWDRNRLVTSIANLKTFIAALGRQVSKLEAAFAGKSRYPEWSALIGWAELWWYQGGSDADVGRFNEVRQFVSDVSTGLLEHYEVLLADH